MNTAKAGYLLTPFIQQSMPMQTRDKTFFASRKRFQNRMIYPLHSRAIAATTPFGTALWATPPK